MYSLSKNGLLLHFRLTSPDLESIIVARSGDVCDTFQLILKKLFFKVSYIVTYNATFTVNVL